MGGTGMVSVRRSRWRTARRWIIASTSIAVIATGLSTDPAAWAQERHGHHLVAAPATKNGTAVPFKAKTAAAKDPAKTAARRTSDLEKRPVTWPKAAAATLTSSSTGSSDGSSVGDLPLKVSPPVATKTRSASTAPAAKSVSVHVADRKAA